MAHIDAVSVSGSTAAQSYKLSSFGAKQSCFVKRTIGLLVGSHDASDHSSVVWTWRRV